MKYTVNIAVDGSNDIDVEASDVEEAREKAMEAFATADLSKMVIVGTNAVSCTDEDGNEVADLEGVNINIPLTSLQITTLNGIAMEIHKGEDDYFSYEDSLSAEEDAYLRDRLLDSYGIVIDKEAGVELRGETARKWLEGHFDKVLNTEEK